MMSASLYKTNRQAGRQASGRNLAEGGPAACWRSRVLLPTGFPRRGPALLTAVQLAEGPRQDVSGQNLQPGSLIAGNYAAEKSLTWTIVWWVGKSLLDTG